MKQPKRILVPTDFSDNSAKALRRAIEEAEGGETEIVLLHVIHEEIIQCADTYCLDEETLERIKSQSKEKAGRHLEELAQRLNAAHKVKIIPKVKVGIPYKEILDEQKNGGADLIIMSHLHTGLVNFLLGDVVDKVIRGASCSVLLVR